MGERFYTLEHKGFPIDPTREGRSGGQTGDGSTEVMVLDRAYCHRVVWSSWTGRNMRQIGSCNTERRLADSRRFADSLCAKLNAEDRAA